MSASEFSDFAEPAPQQGRGIPKSETGLDGLFDLSKFISTLVSEMPAKILRHDDSVLLTGTAYPQDLGEHGYFVSSSVIPSDIQSAERIQLADMAPQTLSRLEAVNIEEKACWHYELES